MYSDDLFIPSPTEHSLHQNLSLLDTICQNLALDIDHEITKIMVFQKKAGLQKDKHIFSVRGTTLKHTMVYNYLAMIISTSGTSLMKQ